MQNKNRCSLSLWLPKHVGNQPTPPWAVAFGYQPNDWHPYSDCLEVAVTTPTLQIRKDRHKTSAQQIWVLGLCSDCSVLFLHTSIVQPHLHSGNSLLVLAGCTDQWAGRKTHHLHIHPCRYTLKMSAQKIVQPLLKTAGSKTTVWALQASKSLISNVAGWLHHLSNSVQQVHRDTCTAAGLAASQPVYVYTVTTGPPKCVCQKDWPCCVIEAADSILMAVLGQPTWATILGGPVTELPSIAFLAGPGLTHTPTARPVVTHTMDTATICQGHGERSVTVKGPEATIPMAFCRFPSFLHNLLWHQMITPVLNRWVPGERHPSKYVHLHLSSFQDLYYHCHISHVFSTAVWWGTCNDISIISFTVLVLHEGDRGHTNPLFAFALHFPLISLS